MQTLGTNAPRAVGFGSSRRRVIVELAVLVGGLGALVLFVLWFAARAAGWLVGWMPPSVDRALGEPAWTGEATGPRHCTAPATLAYVDTIAAPLLANLTDQRFAFRFAVIDDPEPNAFALPGGFVVVHLGLLAEAESGEEVAGVLAHELSHVTLRHGLTRVLRKAGGAMVLGLLVGWTDAGALARLAGDLGDLGYDRDQERAADAAGRALAARAGIDPDGLASFFGRLKARHGDAAGLAKILSSHPGLAERAAVAAPPLAAPRLALPSPRGLACR